MFLSLSLAVLMAAIPPELNRLVENFVDAIRRHDRIAARGLHPLRHSLGTSYDRLRLMNDIEIESWRIVSMESVDDGVLLNVEMVGTATSANTDQPVRWPRWWTIHAVQIDGAWVLNTALMTERYLAEKHWQRGPDELSSVLTAHPELDFAAFMYFIADQADTPGAPDVTPTIQWMAREAGARGMPSVQALAYGILSTNAPTAAASLEAAEKSVPYAEASGDAETLAGAYRDLGFALAASGRTDEAVVTLRRSASYYDRAFDPRIANSALFKASELEIERNNLRAALADAELYETMIRKHAFPNDRRLAAYRVAEIHERLGNSEIALRHFEQAREIAETQHDPEWQLRTAQKIALQHLALGNTDHARGLLQDARWLYQFVVEQELIVTNETLIAAMELDAGQVAGSEFAIDSALNVIAKETIFPTSIGDVYLQRSVLRLVQGRPEEALSDARRAREHGGTSRADALTAEGRALRSLSKNEAAEEVLRAAIDLIELELSQLPVDEVGSGQLLSARLGPYRELLDLLAEQGCAREALTVAERMRARSLRQTLEFGRVDLSAGLDAEKREREKTLEQGLAEVNRKILATSSAADRTRLQQERDEARLELRHFRSELYATHPDLERRRPEAGLHGEVLQPVVPAGQLVLELAVLDQSVFVFALHDREVEVHRIAVSRAVLERQIDAFVSSLEQRDLDYTKHARALYDLLLGPVAKELSAATSVRFVPDGAMWRLPFHALVDGEGKHLVERVAVAYSPSLALARATVRPPTPRTLLAFGDPAVRSDTAQATRSFFRDVTLGRLPDAASEARGIARLYGGANVRIGADARESVFKEDAPAYRVLHLAAHSIIDDRAPMFSSIVLSSSGKNPLEDGLLEAREIAKLDLHADLAVLSACETARGAVTPGEGVIGLSWAFLAAGVPTTVVSQWKVGSASTAELMIEFHRQLRGGRKEAEALRTAMLELRRDPRWRHPFYWAPFAVIQNNGIPSERP